MADNSFLSTEEVEKLDKKIAEVKALLGQDLGKVRLSFSSIFGIFGEILDFSFGNTNSR